MGNNTNKMAQEQKGHTHDDLIVKCQISSDQLNKTEAKIKNAAKFDKLLSNITKAFPFLKQLNKSDWTICIQSQFINKNDDMSKLQSILSQIPPPATISIVWKTRKQPPPPEPITEVKSTEVKRMAKYFIGVHFEGKKFIHGIDKDKDDWDEQIYNDLITAILREFNLRRAHFDLFGDGEVSIDDQDDIVEAFEEFDSDDSEASDDDIAEEDKTRPTVNVFVKLNAEGIKYMEQNPIKKVIPKPDISLIEDSDTVISLGFRLKLLEQCIAYNKYKYECVDEKCELEDVKSELDSGLECVLKDLKEIAVVEGHANSHIMSTLDSISDQLSNNDFTSASKAIDAIINEVMPFDFEEFFELFDATQKTAKTLKDKVCWVLLGPTGAGKSTSIHFICGSRFKQGNAGSVIVNNVDKSLQDKDIQVGEQITESKTRYIDSVDLDLSQYSNINFKYNTPQQILLVDSPGFEDTAGPEVNIANGIGTIRALKKAKLVKVIITFKEAHLDYKFKIIRNIAMSMGEAINNLEDELQKGQKSAITGFLTKSNHGIESAQQLFIDAFTEQKNKDKNSNQNALFKALTYKLGKVGPLYDIHIDVQNIKNNEEKRKQILKSLVEETGYITAPSYVFNEFISESSLSALKQQIGNNYDTIQNILNNDTYFGNTKYIKYIIYILNNINKLKNIINKAGGKYVESRLEECMDLLKTKWNNKILKGSNILRNINIKECSIRSFKKKINEFNQVQKIMKGNIKVIKSCKYHHELKDTNCLNDGLYECFDEIYDIISNYLQHTTQKLNDTEGTETSIDSIEHEDSEESRYIYNDYRNDKIILSSVEKCCLLYKQTQQAKTDKYVRRQVKNLEKLLEKNVKDLRNKLDRFIASKESQNMNGVHVLMYMFSYLLTLHKILNIMDESNNKNQETTGYLAEDDLDYSDDNGNTNKSSKVLIIIEESANKVKSYIARNIEYICKSFSLNVMDVYNNDVNVNDSINKYVDVDVLLKSKIIKSHDQIRSRENKLVSFCQWINQLHDSLCDYYDSILYEISIFKDLKSWLNDIQNKWIRWLCGACFDELKTCNTLLMNQGAQSWNNVELLLTECKSLRKVDSVSFNTAQDYFKTVCEFDFSKTEFASKINDKNVNYDEIIEIAGKLHNAGCSADSTEMKQIYNKLKQHLNDLKGKTEAIVLTVEMSDDLIIVQDTMKELDTIQAFAMFMPDIKKDVNECYEALNHQVLHVLKEIKGKYDLSQHSTASSRGLKENLKLYLNVKSKIDRNILNEVIMQCELKTLTELISLNEDKINELQNENEQIEQQMAQKCGKITKDINKYQKMFKKGKSILIYGDSEDFDEWLSTISFESLKQIKNKNNELKEQLETICNKEKDQKEYNTMKINELHTINTEVKKCAEAEKSLMLLQPADKVIEYRINNSFLTNSIAKLQKLLVKNPNYLFTENVSLPNAYNTLKFLNKCKRIKWSLRIKMENTKEELSNKYVNSINANVLQYLKAYGDMLESNLNNLMGNLAIKNVSNCDLNDEQYVNATQNNIAKLNDLMRVFREISNFDHQIKLQMKDNHCTETQLKLVSCLFTNRDIQFSVDNYMDNIISMHKQDIVINFSQWKIQRPHKLPVLYFICLSMSALDAFVTLNKDEQETYYRIASRIDSELTKFGNNQSKQIIPLFENDAWNELKQSLDALKKTADANKDGIAQHVYRNAVMQLLAVLNKLMYETETKLLIAINKDNDLLVHEINKGLERIKSLVETIYPHLNYESEKDKVKNEEKALGSLLSDRLKLLMRAAVQSAKKRDFRKCEKRLDNVSRLMDYNVQFYIDDNMITDNGCDNEIITEYNKMQQQIDKELNAVFVEVENANKSLTNPNVLNPYNRLRLTTLHEHLAKSQNEKFCLTWDNIREDTVNAIQNVLNEIKQRNYQIQMPNEYHTEYKQMMTYSKQEEYLRKIKTSLPLFPIEMKQIIQAMLKDATDCAKENTKVIQEEFKELLDHKLWNEVAKRLNQFETNDPTFFQNSRKAVITKISKEFETFVNNMKTVKGVVDNIDNLDLYKAIALSFTRFKYITHVDNIINNKDVITIPHIQITLEQIYKCIGNKFMNKCRDISSSLNRQKPYKYLKDSFIIVIKILENKHKLPHMFAQNIMNESRKSYKSIQKLINTSKSLEFKVLDKNSYEIDAFAKKAAHLMNDKYINFSANECDMTETSVDPLFSTIEYDETEYEEEKMRMTDHAIHTDMHMNAEVQNENQRNSHKIQSLKNELMEKNKQIDELKEQAHKSKDLNMRMQLLEKKLEDARQENNILRQKLQTFSDRDKENVDAIIYKDTANISQNDSSNNDSILNQEIMLDIEQIIDYEMLNNPSLFSMTTHIRNTENDPNSTINNYLTSAPNKSSSKSIRSSGRNNNNNNNSGHNNQNNNRNNDSPNDRGSYGNGSGGNNNYPNINIHYENNNLLLLIQHLLYIIRQKQNIINEQQNALHRQQTIIAQTQKTLYNSMNFYKQYVLTQNVTDQPGKQIIKPKRKRCLPNQIYIRQNDKPDYDPIRLCNNKIYISNLFVSSFRNVVKLKIHGVRNFITSLIERYSVTKYNEMIDYGFVDKMTNRKVYLVLRKPSKRQIKRNYEFQVQLHCPFMLICNFLRQLSLRRIPLDIFQLCNQYYAPVTHIIYNNLSNISNCFGLETASISFIRSMLKSRGKDILKKCNWKTIGILSRKNNKKRTNILFTEKQFIADILLNCSDEIRLIPIIEYNKSNVSFVWITRIGKDVDIGLALYYNGKDVKIDTIYCDKDYLLQRHYLTHPIIMKDCKCLNKCNFSIDDIHIGSPDAWFNKIKRLRSVIATNKIPNRMKRYNVTDVANESSQSEIKNASIPSTTSSMSLTSPMSLSNGTISSISPSHCFSPQSLTQISKLQNAPYLQQIQVPQPITDCLNGNISMNQDIIQFNSANSVNYNLQNTK